MHFEGYSKILNEFAGYKSVIQGCAKKTVDELGYEIVVPPQNLGAEDFAYYALEKPCVYIHVGGANPADPRTYSPHHSKGFMLDEDMLDIALECELAFYLKATGQA